MKNSDFEAFDELMELLARYYRQQRLDAQTISDYFKQLSFFSIEFVAEAVERAPGVHPSWFPKVGELIAICQSIVEEVREAEKHKPRAEQEQWRQMKNCEHEMRYQEETPENLARSGGFLVGFNVCLFCGFARPVFSSAIQFGQRRKYLEAGMRAA